MTIEVDGDFGDATVYSGTFAMRLTMSTSASDSTYEVRENGVLVDRDNTTYHGISNDYTIGVELTGPGFTFDFEADGGNSMTGSTHQSLDTQTTMAVKQSDAGSDYVLVFDLGGGNYRTIESGSETRTIEGNGVDGQYVVVSPIGPGGSPSGVAYGATEWVKRTEWSSYYRDSHNNYESEEGGDHTETFNPNTGAIDTQSGSHSQWSQGGGSGSGSGSGSATGSSSSSTWGSAGTIGVGAGFAVAAATPAPAPTPTLSGAAAALQSQGLTPAANVVSSGGTTDGYSANSSTFVWNTRTGPLDNGGWWEYHDDGVNWWYYEFISENQVTFEDSGTYTSTLQAALYRAAWTFNEQYPESYASAREAASAPDEIEIIPVEDALKALPDEAIDALVLKELGEDIGPSFIANEDRATKIELLEAIYAGGWQIQRNAMKPNNSDWTDSGYHLDHQKRVITINTWKWKKDGIGNKGTRYWQGNGLKSNNELAAALSRAMRDQELTTYATGFDGVWNNPTRDGVAAFFDAPGVRVVVGVLEVAGGILLIVESGGAYLPIFIGGYSVVRGADNTINGVVEISTGERYRLLTNSALDQVTGDPELTDKILFWTDIGVGVVDVGNGVKVFFRRKAGSSAAGTTVETHIKKVDGELQILDNGPNQLRRFENDIAVDGRRAPKPMATKGRGFDNPVQQREADEWVNWAESKGAKDVRVNQTQVGPDGTRVGANRPDIQFTLGEGTHTLPDGTTVTVPPGETRRIYVEFDTPKSGRGPTHFRRTYANDPDGIVILKILPNPSDVPVLVVP